MMTNEEEAFVLEVERRVGRPYANFSDAALESAWTANVQALAEQPTDELFHTHWRILHEAVIRRDWTTERLHRLEWGVTEDGDLCEVNDYTLRRLEELLVEVAALTRRDGDDEFAEECDRLVKESYLCRKEMKEELARAGRRDDGHEIAG